MASWQHVIGVLSLASGGCGLLGYQPAADPSPDAGTSANGAPTIAEVASFSSGPPTFLDSLVEDVAVSAAGKIYLVGAFGGTATLGTTELTATADDGYLAALDPDLSFDWATSIGAQGTDDMNSVTTSATGDPIAWGLFEASIDPGGGTIVNQGGDDQLLLRYSSSGTFVDARGFGSSNDDDFGTGIDADGTGGFWVSTGCAPPLDYGDGPVPGGGSRGLCLVHFDSSNTLLAAHRFDGAGQDAARAIDVLPNGDVAVVGTFQSDLPFGSTVLDAGGARDAFLARVQSDGQVEFAVQLGADVVASAGGVDHDSSGNLFVSVRFDGTVTIAGQSYTTPAGVGDGIVFAVSGAGAPLWATHITGLGSNELNRLAVVDDTVVIVGAFEDRFSVAGQSFESRGLDDLMVFGLSATDGSLEWAVQVGGEGDDEAHAVAIGPEGDIVVAGYVSGTVAVGDTVVTGSGASAVVFRLERTTPE